MQTVNKYPVNIVSSNKIIIEWELLNKLRAGSLFFFCHEVQKCLHLHALIQQTTAKSHTSSHYNIYMYVHSEYNQSDLVIALPISSIHTSLWKQQSSSSSSYPTVHIFSPIYTYCWLATVCCISSSYTSPFHLSFPHTYMYIHGYTPSVRSAAGSQRPPVQPPPVSPQSCGDSRRDRGHEDSGSWTWCSQPHSVGYAPQTQVLQIHVHSEHTLYMYVTRRWKAHTQVTKFGQKKDLGDISNSWSMYTPSRILDGKVLIIGRCTCRWLD